jgi:hypothetical protein
MLATKVKKESKKVLLFVDDKQYLKFKQLEKTCFNVVNQLLAKAEISLGKDQVDDISKLLDNPSKYLIERYSELFSKYSPPVTNKIYLFESMTRVTLVSLDALKQMFDDTSKAMGKYAPAATKTGLESKLKREHFNKYLNESKRPYYEALNSFIDSANNLQKYGAEGSLHLQRFCSDIEQDDNSNITINFYNFL